MIFTAQAMVRIYTAQEIDGLARNVYNRMIDRLTAGNVTNAVKAINITARDNFAQLFTSYGADLGSIGESLRGLREARISQELVTFTIVKNEADGANAYFVYLLRGEDGIWRIDSM